MQKKKYSQIRLQLFQKNPDFHLQLCPFGNNPPKKQTDKVRAMNISWTILWTCKNIFLCLTVFPSFFDRFYAHVQISLNKHEQWIWVKMVMTCQQKQQQNNNKKDNKKKKEKRVRSTYPTRLLQDVIHDVSTLTVKDSRCSQCCVNRSRSNVCNRKEPGSSRINCRRRSPTQKGGLCWARSKRDS